MRKASEDLYRIIKCLSRREYEKIKCQIQGDSRLFLLQMIRTSKEFNEEKYKAKFQKRYKRENYGIAKYQLYKSLVHLLHILYKEEDRKYLEQLHSINVLYNKGLYNIALKEVRKLKQELKEKEDFVLLLKALFWEYKIFSHFREFILGSDAIMGQLIEISDLIKDDIFYKVYINKLRKNVRKYEPGKLVKLFEEFHKRFHKEPSFATLKFSHYTFLVEYYAYIMDKPSKIKANIQYVETLLNNKWLLKKNENHFNMGVYRLLNSLIEERQWEEVLKYSSFFSWNNNNKNLLEVLITGLRLKLIYYSGYLDPMQEEISQAERVLEENRNYLYSIVIISGLLSVHFLVSRYSDALKYANELLNNEYIRKLNIGYIHFRLIKLIILYEQQYYDLLSYELTSLYKMLRRQRMLLEYEKFIIRVIRNLIRFNPNEGKLLNNYFTSVYEEVLGKPTLRYQLAADIDFISWLKSEVENKALIDVHFQTCDKKLIAETLQNLRF